MKIGIIGYGKMGQLFYKLFENHGFDVLINDPKIKSASFQRVIKGSDYIMISANNEGNKKILTKLAKISKNGDLSNKLIFDISTFKKEIIKYYNKFSSNVLLSSIHPLFGSGMKDPKKHHIAIIPISKNDGSKLVENLFSNIGFNTFYVDYETHDKIISLTIGLSYIAGISLNKILTSYNKDIVNKLSGTTFKYLRNHYLSILNDSPEFVDYIFSQKEVKNVLKNYRKILSDLSDKNKRNKILNEIYSNSDEKEIEYAYKKMYSCIESY